MHALSSEQFHYDKQCSSYYGAAQHDSLVLLSVADVLNFRLSRA
jgi:hypothetical protein